MKWYGTRLCLLPVAMLALSACMITAPTYVDGGNVGLGQTAYVNGARIRPVAILEDSRCPTNAQCVWAGRVRLQLLWLRPSGNQSFELILGEAKPLADGTITLTSVRPDKPAQAQPAPADYRFTFEFQGSK